jgi:anti-sigma B factor antagonist
MEVSEKRVGDVVVVTLAGRFIGGTEATALHKKAKQLLEDGVNKMVVDLDQVTLMNSTGLGALMSAVTSLRAAGGDLRVSRIQGKMKNLFMVTDIISIFKVFDSTEEAIASFAD